MHSMKVIIMCFFGSFIVMSAIRLPALKAFELYAIINDRGILIEVRVVLHYF